ncbi:MAG: lactate utilization protein [Candidatus Omnitrophota bacterium]|nr:lactate utilization protein [Candidatus Omnitrophota bacterium]
MDKRIEPLIEHWRRRNISGFYCAHKEEAASLMMQMIPAQATVGISGSVTLNQLDIAARLESGGRKVFNQYKAGISPGESLKLRKEGTQADFYLASANALSQKGELVFFSGYGNRSAGIAYAKNVIIVCGVNKITPDLTSALKRAREYATPLNRRRLKNWNAPRMCCQVLIIEAEVAPERLKVILVGETLGF